MMQLFRKLSRTGQYIALVIAIGILAGGGWMLWAQTQTQNEDEHDEYHIHAAFQVYQDNTLLDFSDLKYQHVQPCGEEHDEEPTAEEEQEEKAHLHEGIGYVVHVHRRGALWQDLFTNIGFELSGAPIGYINGQPVDNILENEIGAYDRVLILTGQADDVPAKISALPDEDHIRKIERMSESCGS